jgi:hypothetical protein
MRFPPPAEAGGFQRIIPMKKPNHPNWWILILLCAIMLGLEGLEVRAPFSKTGHTLVEIGLVIILFSLVWRWLCANEKAMITQEMEEYRRSKSPQRSRLKQNENRVGADILENRDGSDHSSEQESTHVSHALPAWVVSLSSIIVGFIKALDK